MSRTDPSVSGQFFKDIAAHTVEIVHDANEIRYLRCRRPGTNCYSFEIVTYPGYLVMSGDMGAWTFTRLRDMFEFFRDGVRGEGNDGLQVNHRYWAEKLDAVDKGGVDEFDRDAYLAIIDERVAEFRAENGGEDDTGAPVLADMPEDLQELIDDLKSGCHELGPRGEIEAYDALDEFEDPEGRIKFTDIWEYNFRRYTFRFTWALYAIVWTIREYDRLKIEAQRVAA